MKLKLYKASNLKCVREGITFVIECLMAIVEHGLYVSDLKCSVPELALCGCATCEEHVNQPRLVKKI